VFPEVKSRLLIIGACGGIGHAVWRAAEDEGLDVTAMDLESSFSRRSIDASDAAIPVDLLDEQSIQNAFAKLADLNVSLDGVAVCSGYTSGSDAIAELDTARFDNVLSGNLRGPVLALREASPLLKDGASVVLLSTAIGQIGARGYAAYGAAKAALNAITRILAAELAPAVRVNGVAPGAVDTAFIRGGFGAGAAEDGVPERIDPEEYTKLVPLGRMGVPDDIVGPVLFLLSDAARYITGQVLHVNGGAFMRD
jgi:3-oxoacyl-[acyl-carrier protein] reductase